MRKGMNWVNTDYITPTEVCAMFNVVLDAKNQVSGKTINIFQDRNEILTVILPNLYSR